MHLRFLRSTVLHSLRQPSNQLRTAILPSAHLNPFRPLPTFQRIASRAMSAEAGLSTAPHPTTSISEPAAPAQDLTSPSPAANGSKPPKEGKPKEGKVKEKKEKKSGESEPLELSPPPEFFSERIKIYDEYKAKYDKWVSEQPREPITITLPDGKEIEGTSWETTPLSIAKGIATSLAERIIIAKVNNQELWDLNRPLESSCRLALLDFDSPDNNYEARQVFWHSSAHVLGEACERRYDGCCLGYGPPLEEGGFFYDMSLAEGRTIGQDDYAGIEDVAKKAVKEKQPFERLELPKEVLLEMFKYNKYKQHYINDKVADGTSSTVYRCGPLIDLCLGPHVPHTGRIKSLAVTKNSSSYFLGDAKNDTFQRVYGMSFPDSKQMTEYKKYLEEAAKRDHRRIGKEQELFTFSELSPGSAFFLPMGMRIYNSLVAFIKSEYHARGFSEVGSPNIFNSKLWEASGHWQNYAEDMFKLKVDDEQYALKPMNCPGHCVIFDSRERSYRELPLRFAEFGVLHRNEASGALSGLSRVRRFIQDDAHIFCTADQVEAEMHSAFDFLKTVYEPFGFTFKVGLSTRNPKKWVGDLNVWNKAEATLRDVLEKQMPGKWHINEEDAAFYGPKLDFQLTDALKRHWQCGTIQLDFNLPERFDLKYRGPEQVAGSAVAGGAFQRPVMIHRAILGSIERFIAIVTESTAGKWPFWLSPRQVVVIPVAAPYKEYATQVAKKYWDAGLYAEADLSDNTLKKKIRNAQVAQWNFIMVVGQDELEGQAVNIRQRDDEVQGREETVKVDVALEKMLKLKEAKSPVSKLDQV
ncbi:threonine-tRNA ligase [Naematelia encephala]|uniref:Probable threonine--tRNA ligase, cytoplasmic n=1 Tax=Naematelia encephala TaxID=71784 RepID=A0A1Y2BB60_9TREE|nr:threonine-tRNA ligase [Naematelia encephala]